MPVIGSKTLYFLLIIIITITYYNTRVRVRLPRSIKRMYNFYRNYNHEHYGNTYYSLQLLSVNITSNRPR